MSSQRKQLLSDMLNSTMQTFQNVLVESTDFVKMTRHSGMKMEKQQMDRIMAGLAERMAGTVREKTDELIKGNKIYENFDELEELIKESEKLNEQLGRTAGYQHINPKRDIYLHLSESTDQVLSDADAEIERLEAELAAVDEELAKKKTVFNELTLVVESQQKKLWG